MPLSPDVVLPLLRGTFGREYHYATETPTTQLMLPVDAGHGAVALAEHQTQGRGRMGRVWVDEPGAGLSFSVVLIPPPPLRQWPQLTLVAAEAIVAALGPRATIKEPNDVLLDGRKVAGVLAETRGERVVLGIGVNVGMTPWPGAAAAGTDRLELLVTILAELERGFDRWAESLAGSNTLQRP